MLLFFPSYVNLKRSGKGVNLAFFWYERYCVKF